MLSVRCKNCSLKHHTLLHDYSKNYKPLAPPSQNVQTLEKGEPSSATSLSYSGTSDSGNILLCTTIVKVKDSMGKWQNCRVLLDSANQMSLISEECCTNLELSRNSSSHTIICTGNQIVRNSDSFVKLEFTFLLHPETYFVNTLIIRSLTTNLTNFHMSHYHWNHIQNLQLADPEFQISKPINIILGADISFELMRGNQIKGAKNTPYATDTKLGWVRCSFFSS
ncbi:hypothetical protein AVEN_256842-1 [Araneus ventricosus]|uniref:Uncharacterized protein n=1 Tax=Araneus ventricosus TaxID=182803 RepID=A0A4Y2UGX0_ARAVE|nr:hypothetical protein AVEN_256842-1 [Araneus ventricosus]